MAAEESGGGPLASMTPQRKRQVQYGALAIGALAIWWWVRNRSAAAPAAADTTAAADSIGTIGADLGSSSGSGGYYYPGSASSDTTVPGGGFATNAEWYAAALSAAVDAGYSNMLAATALGNYLAHRPLTAQEQQVVRVGLGAAGNPPVGSYSIVSAPTPPAPSAPSAPRSLYLLSLRKDGATVGWWAAANADRYWVHLDGKYYSTEHGTFKSVNSLRPNTRHTVTVYAINAANKQGPGKSIVFTTKKK